MKLRTITFLVIICIPLLFYSATVVPEDFQGKNRGFGVAALAGALGSIVSAVGSWFEISNETLIADGQNQVHQFNRMYYPINQKISAYFGITQLSFVPYNWQAKMPNEGLLYDIALDLYKQGILWHNFSSDAYEFVKKVIATKDTISNRIVAINLQSKSGYQTEQELQALRKLEASIAWIAEEMHAMYQYLGVDHQMYFKMAHKEWELYRDYGREMLAFDQSIYNTPQLERELSTIIRQKYGQARYAFIRYYQELVSQSTALIRIRELVIYDRYPDRCLWTDKLIAAFNRLAMIVEPWYRYELNQYEAEERVSAYP